MDNIKERCQQLPIIDSTDILGHREYSNRLNHWLNTINELQLYDVEYVKNYEKIVKFKLKPKILNPEECIHLKYKKYDKYIDVSKLNIDEILTIFTYYIRSDRFNEGILVDGILNGNIEKLSYRLNTLVKE